MRSVIAGFAALSLALAACGDDTEDALSAVCDAEEEVAANLASFAELDPTTNTSSDYEDVLDDLESAVEDLRSARGDLAEQDVDNVTNAYDDLQSEVADLDDVPLAELEGEVVAALQEQALQLTQLYATAYANSSCTEESDG